jgi:TolB-like protein/Tfp pilus assembly protein PilF
MDEIFINLSKIHDLRVVSRTSVEQFRNTGKSIPEIAKKLNVNFIVEGSGQKYYNILRLRVKLIDTSSDRQIWAGSYEQEIYETKDLFKMQSEVAQTIASELNATITLEEQELIDRIPTANLTAYDLYMKASAYQNQYHETRNLSTYNKAVTFYKASLELDSSFARAYSDLASLYLTRYFWETYFKENFLDSCLVLANLALSFDGRMDEAYLIIGRCNFEKGNTKEALVNYDKSLEINPGYSDAYAYKGYLFTSLINDYVGGIYSYQKAVNTSPPEYRPDLLRGLGQAYLDVGFIDKAKDCYKQAYEIDRNNGLYLFNLSDIESCLENFEEAIRLGNEASEVDSAYFPETSYFYGPVEHNAEAYLQAKKLLRRFARSGELNLNQAHRVGYAFWKMGKYDEAKNFLKQQIRYSQESIKLKRRMAQYKGAYYDLAATYAFLGNKEKAYQYLNEFNKKKFYSLNWVSLAKHDPLFNSIRNEERFQSVLRNMESRYQEEHERVRKWLGSN